MECHIGQCLDVSCGDISLAIHIHKNSFRMLTLLDYEGTNQIVHLNYNSFTLGLEDHRLNFFDGVNIK